MTKHNMKWLRAITPEIIPKYLIEQVKDRQYEVKDFYTYQEANCMNDDGTLNPFNHLYALRNEDNLVKGVLWFVIDPLTKNVLINTYSIDKEYWYNGEAMKYVAEHMKNIMKKLKLKRAYWAYRYPKHAERNGFKRSKSILMEFSPEEEQQEAKQEA